MGLEGITVEQRGTVRFKAESHNIFSIVKFIKANLKIFRVSKVLL